MLVGYLVVELKLWGKDIGDFGRIQVLGVLIEERFQAVINVESGEEGDKGNELDHEDQECSDHNLYGKIVHDADEAYNLYKNHGIRLGFSVRKMQKRYDINKELRALNFCCSKEGFRKDSNPVEEKKLHRLLVRTGCQARIRFTREGDVWKVSLFDSEHNHELATPDERQFLRSNRNVSSPHKGAIKTMMSAGIRTTHTYKYLAKEAGESQSVGFTKTDCYNFVSREKMSKLEAGDAQSLINLFKHKQAEDPMFFYSVQVDQENRMTNFFWRDGRSKINYDCFGDVMVFDTTYRTNRYDMICAPFVGVNQHWNNTLFGCAFLLDETTATFKWLFETFLEAMGGRRPTTIFTDQCQAMANAIELVFSKTVVHRLCTWHISKNAARNLPSLYGKPGFKELFNKLLQGRLTEEEFYRTWDELKVKFDAGSNKWLMNLYSLQENWSPVFSLDHFSAGIRSTQRSESTNNVFQNISATTLTLTEFVLHYDDQAENMHTKEREETYHCRMGAPSRIASSSGILKHAANVYTRKMFRLFEKEFASSLAVRMTETRRDETMQTFELNEEGHERGFFVQFNPSTHEITCSCKRSIYIDATDKRSEKKSKGK